MILEKKRHWFHPSFENLLQALKSCTHLAIGAHPDDLEIMAFPAILDCFKQENSHFVGIVCTTGASKDDIETKKQRWQEQMDAANFGEYGAVLGLDFTSDEIRGGLNEELLMTLNEVFSFVKPKVICAHNPLDQHSTHVAVFKHLHEVVKTKELNLESFLGCEVWGGLERDKSSVRRYIAADAFSWIERLIRFHKSQISLKRDFAKAVVHRLVANASFFDPYTEPDKEGLHLAMDLNPIYTRWDGKLESFVQEKNAQISDNAGVF